MDSEAEGMWLWGKGKHAILISCFKLLVTSIVVSLGHGKVKWLKPREQGGRSGWRGRQGFVGWGRSLGSTLRVTGTPAGF